MKKEKYILKLFVVRDEEMEFKIMELQEDGWEIYGYPFPQSKIPHSVEFWMNVPMRKLFES